MDNPSIVRNRVSMSVFDQCIPASVIRAGRVRIRQWPVVAGSTPTGTGRRGLKRRDGGRVTGQDAVELAARADVELHEDLAQVVLDRARADEQPGADLRIREPVAGEPRDLGLLGGELVARLDGAFAGRLAGGQELAPGPLGEPLHAHRVQHLVGDAQLLARVDAAALAAQPLAVEQMRAGELHAHAGTAEACDRLAVVTLSDLTLAQQRAHAGFNPECPLGGSHTRALGQPLQYGRDERYVTG